MNAELLPMETSAVAGRPASRRYVWLVLAIILAGCVARSWNFYKPDLWVDEFVSYWIVEDGGARSALLRNNHYSTTQPLYFLILDQSVRLFGRNEFALRLPSIVFSCLFLPVVYLLFKELAQRKAALLSLFLVAMNPLLIYYGREARPYALCMFLVACSFLAFIRWTRDPESKSLMLFWLCATVALIYTHGIYGLAIVVQCVILLCLALRDVAIGRRVVRSWVLLQVVTLVLVIPVLLQLRSVLARREDIDFVRVAPDVWQAMSFFSVPGLFVGLLAGLTLCLLAREERRLDFSVAENWRGLLFLLCMFIIPTVTLAAIGMKQPMLFSLRYRLIAAIGAMGMTGIIAFGWHSRWMRVAITSALIVMLSFQAAWSLHRSGLFATDFEEFRGAKKLLLNVRDYVGDADVMVIRSSVAEGNVHFDSSDPLWRSYLTCEVSSFYFKNAFQRICLPRDWNEIAINQLFRPEFDTAVSSRDRFWYFGWSKSYGEQFENWLKSGSTDWRAVRRFENGKYELVEYARQLLASLIADQ